MGTTRPLSPRKKGTTALVSGLVGDSEITFRLPRRFDRQDTAPAVPADVGHLWECDFSLFPFGNGPEKETFPFSPLPTTGQRVLALSTKPKPNSSTCSGASGACFPLSPHADLTVARCGTGCA